MEKQDFDRKLEQATADIVRQYNVLLAQEHTRIERQYKGIIERQEQEIRRLKTKVNGIIDDYQACGNAYLQGALAGLQTVEKAVLMRAQAQQPQPQPEMDFDLLFQNADFPLLESVNEQIDL